jgi:hypothetical protein
VVSSYGDAYGLYVRELSAPQVENNRFEVEAVGRARGVDARQITKLALYKNLFRVRGNQQRTGMVTYDATGVSLFGNDFILEDGTSREEAIGLAVSSDSRVWLQNNVFVGNGSGVGVANLNGRVTEGSGYNLIWQFRTPVEGDWPDFRTLNLVQDPEFDRQNQNYELYWDVPGNFSTRHSPCIDAGTPEVNDPDGSRSDMGWRYKHYDQLEVLPPPAAVQEFQVLQAFPNPFNSRTRFIFRTGNADWARLEVFDLAGRKVQGLWSRGLDSGLHTLDWNATGLVAGEYIARLTTPDGVESRRITLSP